MAKAITEMVMNVGEETEKIRGFVCECGEEHRYTSYVYAHWLADLHHTCDKCGTVHSICNGVATIND